MRTDEQFKPESREALTQSYCDIGEQVDEKIGEYFSLVPKTPLEIKPYEEYREKFEAGGSYNWARRTVRGRGHSISTPMTCPAG